MAKKALKDRVASFRINRATDDEIAAKLTANPIAGCDSTNKLYRKLALDFHAGRLVYTNPEDALADPDVLNAMASIDKLPSVEPSDPQGQS
jgi:hypothetical protein